MPVTTILVNDSTTHGNPPVYSTGVAGTSASIANILNPAQTALDKAISTSPTVAYTLAPPPADFVSAASVKATVKHRSINVVNDTLTGYVQIVKADGTTPLTNQVQIWASAATWADQTRVLTMDVLDPGDLAIWSGAKLRLSQATVANMGADAGIAVLVDAVSIELTYVANPPITQDAYRFYEDGPETGPLIDIYPETNPMGGMSVAVGQFPGQAQSFLGNGGTLASAGFYLRTNGGVPNGTITAYLYAHTGTFGSSSLPTGAALATSNPIPSASVTSIIPSWFDFYFPSGYQLSSGTPYVIALITTNTVATGLVASTDTTSPTHGGNFSSYNGTSWAATSGTDLIFRVYDNAPSYGALVPQNTPATVNTALADVNLHVRTRLQAAAIPVDATDDFQLQYEQTRGGVATSRGLSELVYIFGGGGVSNWTSPQGAETLIIQNLPGNGEYLTKVGFYMNKGGAPTGQLFAELRNSTGATLLATSTSSLDVTTLSTSTWTWCEFDFAPYKLVEGTTYRIGTGALASSTTVNYISLASISSGSTSSHAGYRRGIVNSWAAYDTGELHHRVYTVGTWAPVGAPHQTLVDEWDKGTQSYSPMSSTLMGNGQSFMGNGQTLAKARFKIHRDGMPVETVQAHLMSHTGTFGTSSSAGQPLSSSLAKTAAEIGTYTAAPWVEFEFPDSYVMQAGTPYCIVFQISQQSNGTAYYNYWNSQGHAGNGTYYQSSTWTSNQTNDLAFAVYSRPPTTPSIANLTSGSSINVSNGASSDTMPKMGFVGNGQALHRAGFKMARATAVAGTLKAVLYSSGHTILATSQSLDVARLGSVGYPWIEFEFDGQTILANGTTYYIGLDTNGITTPSWTMYMESCSSSTPTLYLITWRNGAWFSNSLTDLMYRIYTGPSTAVAPYVSPYLTTLCDSYDQIYGDTNYSPSGSPGVGQSFTGNGGVLAQAGFYMYKATATTGTIVAELYEHTGTFGTNGSPTGSPLATSTTVINQADLPASLAWVNFNFAPTHTLVNGTKYFIVIMGSEVNNNYAYRTDGSSPAHSGNRAIKSAGTWTASPSADAIFRVYTVGEPPTTKRLTGGTGTFTTGKASGDGTVNDLAIPANGHTEVLYSVTVKSPAVVEGDTLKFRTVRNGSSNFFTYSQTPQLTVTTTTGPSNTATATHLWTATATGSAPVVPPKLGSATAAHTWTIGPASGWQPRRGQATSSHTWTIGPVTGKRVTRTAQVTSSHLWTQTATGRRTTRGQATATHLWTVAPATGKRTMRGSATATHLWNTVATGKRVQKGSAVIGWYTTFGVINETFDLPAGTSVIGNGWGNLALANNLPILVHDGLGNGSPQLGPYNYYWGGATNATTLPDNYVVEMPFSVTAASIDPAVGVFIDLHVRAPIRGSHYSGGYGIAFGNWVVSDGSVDGIRIRRLGSDIGQEVAMPFTAGEHLLRVEVNGGNIVVKYDGVQKLNYTDPAPVMGQYLTLYAECYSGTLKQPLIHSVTAGSSTAVGLSPLVPVKQGAATATWLMTSGYVIDDSFNGAVDTQLTSIGYVPMYGGTLHLDGNGNAITKGGWGGVTHPSAVINNSWLEAAFRLDDATSYDISLLFKLPSASASNGVDTGYSVAIKETGITINRLGVNKATVAQSLVNTKDYVVRVEWVGGTIRIFLDGAEIGNWTDPSPLVGNYIGLYLDNNYAGTSDLLRYLRAGTAPVGKTPVGSAGAGSAVVSWVASLSNVQTFSDTFDGASVFLTTKPAWGLGSGFNPSMKTDGAGAIINTNDAQNTYKTPLPQGQWAEIDFIGGDGYVSIMARLPSVGNDDTGYEIAIDSGSPGDVAGVYFSRNWSPWGAQRAITITHGQPYTMRAELNGGSIRLLLNGTLVLASYDPSPVVGSYIGLIQIDKPIPTTITAFRAGTVAGAVGRSTPKGSATASWSTTVGGAPPLAVTAGLAVRLEADTLALANNAAVTAWPNPGAAVDPEIYGAVPPVFKTSTTPAGKPVVHFSTSEGTLRFPGTTGVALDYTLVYISRQQSTGRVVSSIYPDFSNILFGYHNNLMDVAYDVGFFEPAVGRALDPAAWNMYSADCATGTVPRFFIDGVYKNSGATQGTGWNGSFTLNGYGGFSGEETCICDVAGVLLYDRKLAEVERQQAEDYLRSKYLTGGGSGGPIGVQTPKGSATVSWTASPAGAVGKQVMKGAATPLWTATVAPASGKKIQKGAATSGHLWRFTPATGVTPILGVKQGTATATHTWTTAPAVGKRITRSSAVTVAHAWSITVAGKKIQKGQATTGHLWTVGPVTGKRYPQSASITASHVWTIAPSTGKKTQKGQATSSHLWTVAPATGKPIRKGQATSTHLWSVAPTTGRRVTYGQTAAAHLWKVLPATGVTPILGVKQGTATVNHVWTSAPAVGKRYPKAQVISAHTWAVTATGQKYMRGAASPASHTWSTAPATGKRYTKSTVVTASHLWNATVVGKRYTRGQTTSLHTWNTFPSTGITPILGVKQGTALARHDWTSTATGKKVMKARADATHAWTQIATGTKPLRGTATVAHTWTVAPSVGKRIMRTTQVTAAHLWRITPIAGVRRLRGQATADYLWTSYAEGLAPVLDAEQGSAILFHMWSVAPVSGRRITRGAATSTHQWTTSATGKRVMRGSTAAVTHLWWVNPSTGLRYTVGLATVVHVWRPSAEGLRFTSGSAVLFYQFNVTGVLGSAGVVGSVYGWWNGRPVVEMQYGDEPIFEWMMVEA